MECNNANGDFVTRNIAGFGFSPLNYSVCISRYYLDTPTKRMKRSDGGGELSVPGNESSNGDLPITKAANNGLILKSLALTCQKH
ncbi:hypothetical protein MKX03_024259 [Papaver bracteatum]|nr:hypothetical protein MKX03_024259 [Papaver bracteatum]